MAEKTGPAEISIPVNSAGDITDEFLKRALTEDHIKTIKSALVKKGDTVCIAVKQDGT